MTKACRMDASIWHELVNENLIPILFNITVISDRICGVNSLIYVRRAVSKDKRLFILHNGHYLFSLSLTTWPTRAAQVAGSTYLMLTQLASWPHYWYSDMISYSFPNVWQTIA